jgi:hypothetical protein
LFAREISQPFHWLHLYSSPAKFLHRLGVPGSIIGLGPFDRVHQEPFFFRKDVVEEGVCFNCRINLLSVLSRFRQILNITAG